MRNKHALAMALLTGISRTPLAAQSQRNIHPRPCARADSVLPEDRDALTGQVRVTYWSDGDSTSLATGGPLTARAQALMAGHGPSAAPVAQLTIFLRGVQTELVQRGQQPPVVTLITDDSVSLELSPIKFGTFVARGPTPPPRWVITIPLSAELDPPSLLAIARARDAAVQIGPVKLPIEDRDRRDIAALYLAMLCGIEETRHEKGD